MFNVLFFLNMYTKQNILQKSTVLTYAFNILNDWWYFFCSKNKNETQTFDLCMYKYESMDGTFFRHIFCTFSAQCVQGKSSTNNMAIIEFGEHFETCKKSAKVWLKCYSSQLLWKEYRLNVISLLNFNQIKCFFSHYNMTKFYIPFKTENTWHGSSEFRNFCCELI